MKFVVVGLGSMGKRRIRCLKELGYSSIVGFDIREDRINEASNTLEIQAFNNLDIIIEEFDPDAIIISVPPDKHHLYIEKAIKYKKHFFVEASVIDDGFEIISETLKKANFVGCPSATFCFHPAIKLIKNIVKDKKLGKISNFNYHSGQYLPDWHVYENVEDFYVSNPITGGAREIVPFELTWITDIFGLPQKIIGQNKKTIDIKGAEKIDDTYNILMEFKDHLGVMTVDVVSRYAIRNLVINGSLGQLNWDWNRGDVQVFQANHNKWTTFNYNSGSADSSYNKNLGEEMYIEELRSFIKSFDNIEYYPNNFEKDQQILNLLYAAELSYKNEKVQKI